jgi:hypothetical protein
MATTGLLFDDRRQSAQVSLLKALVCALTHVMRLLMNSEVCRTHEPTSNNLKR